MKDKYYCSKHKCKKKREKGFMGIVTIYCPKCRKEWYDDIRKSRKRK